MEPVSRLFCSASTCKLPIRKGDLYHDFRNNKPWLDRLREDGSDGYVVCFRHFSPRQYAVSRRSEKPKLKKDAIPDQRILCCRFCTDLSVEMERLQTVPSSDPNTLTLQDLVETIGIRIDPADDGIPALICLTCSTKVRYIKRIQRQFQEADRKMRQMHASLVEEGRKIVAETEEEQFVKFNDKNEHPSNDRKIVKTYGPVKPPGPVKDTDLTRSVKKEPDIVTEQVVDSSSNSIFTIQSIVDYGCEKKERDTDSLQTEDTDWIPPVKKIKEEVS